MSIGHAISGVELLTPLGVDTIVIKYPSNQITNNSSNFIVEVIILAYIRMSIYLGDFPWWWSNCDING